MATQVLEEDLKAVEMEGGGFGNREPRKKICVFVCVA